GSVTGISGNGINALTADSVINLTNTQIMGGTNGINVVGTSSAVEVTGGSVEGESGSGISSSVTLVPLLGGRNAIKLNETSVIGATDGVSALTLGLGIGGASSVDASTSVILTGSNVIGASGSGIS